MAPADKLSEPLLMMVMALGHGYHFLGPPRGRKFQSPYIPPPRRLTGTTGSAPLEVVCRHTPDPPPLSSIIPHTSMSRNQVHTLPVPAWDWGGLAKPLSPRGDLFPIASHRPGVKAGKDLDGHVCLQVLWNHWSVVSARGEFLLLIQCD